MSIKYSNKINKIRTFALSLVFIGLFIAYLGVFFRENIIIMTTFMMVGFLSVIASTVVYHSLKNKNEPNRPEPIT